MTLFPNFKNLSNCSLTQHMQLRVSTTDSREQRHPLSQSQEEGRGRGLRHASHRHRPQSPQIMESRRAHISLAGYFNALI